MGTSLHELVERIDVYQIQGMGKNRTQRIDRMNVYGEGLAVVTSALMFGLFHGNLSQLFYAVALGLVFGTGELLCSRYGASILIFIFII